MEVGEVAAAARVEVEVAEVVATEVVAQAG